MRSAASAQLPFSRSALSQVETVPDGVLELRTSRPAAIVVASGYARARSMVFR